MAAAQNQKTAPHDGAPFSMVAVMANSFQVLVVSSAPSEIGSAPNCDRKPVTMR